MGRRTNRCRWRCTFWKRDPTVRIVDLSRNFGHHKAMMTGLSYARGDLVFLIDSDLEEDPELLASFAATLHSQEADVVYGVQESRKGGTFRAAERMALLSGCSTCCRTTRSPRTC